MMYSLHMLTLNRLERGCKETYLPQTIDSMKRSGIFSSKIPFSFTLHDSGSKDLSFLKIAENLPHTTIRTPVTPLTAIQNFCSMVQYALETPGDILIFMEDDSIFCKNFLESVNTWIEKYFTPSYKLASFYTPYQEICREFANNSATWNYPVVSFYGSVCFAVRKEDIKNLVPYIMEHQENPLPHDLYIKSYFKDTYPTMEYFLASVPSFVQHIGVESSISPGIGIRTCPCWLGEDKSFTG